MKARILRTNDEPPVMWSPGFEANPNSPAGELQGFWRLTGRGSDADEAAERARQRQAHGLGPWLLRTLGFWSRQPKS